MESMGGRCAQRLQISLIRRPVFPPRLALLVHYIALVNSFCIFAFLCSAVHPHPPCVIYIPPLALYKVLGTSLEYDRVKRPGSRSQTARHDLPPKRYYRTSPSL
jgi:hypothetical protein